ncbi:MAG: ribosomal protein S18-alanine N-acetyltransferase [Fibrobacteraceae bacterium]|nr:ribosomal protein S18-alanine N-acetyltransferase [Fibrobacteraceae bacterium]
MQNNNSEILLRKMELSDVGDVLNLQANLAFLDWSLEQYKKELQASSTLSFVIQKQESVVGFALFHLLADESELLAIAVAEEFQQTGLGKILFNAGKNELQNRGAEKLFLEVRESNEKAKKFYQNLGAVFIGTRTKYYKNGESAILYRIDF